MSEQDDVRRLIIEDSRTLRLLSVGNPCNSR
jgi:hypothetical protein